MVAQMAGHSVVHSVALTADLKDYQTVAHSAAYLAVYLAD